jgi:phage shock protein E
VKFLPSSTLRLAAALLFGAALAAGCTSAPHSAAPPAPASSAQPGGQVTQREAQALVQAGARLVDVRTPEEFAEGHMPGALNVPVDVLSARAPGELAPQDGPVVVYCRTGRRSARAAAQLKALGFTQVHDLGPMPEGAGTAR